jgi:hypothetical protein
MILSSQFDSETSFSLSHLYGLFELDLWMILSTKFDFDDGESGDGFAN